MYYLANLFRSIHMIPMHAYMKSRKHKSPISLCHLRLTQWNKKKIIIERIYLRKSKMPTWWIIHLEWFSIPFVLFERQSVCVCVQYQPFQSHSPCTYRKIVKAWHMYRVTRFIQKNVTVLLKNSFHEFSLRFMSFIQLFDVSQNSTKNTNLVPFYFIIGLFTGICKSYPAHY